MAIRMIFLAMCLCLSSIVMGAVAPAPGFINNLKDIARNYQPSTIESNAFDVNAALAGGATSGATGDNAVAAAADEDSGAVGVVGEDTAIGAAAPGAAIGFGFENFFTTGSTDPAATPSAANIFNFFN